MGLLTTILTFPIAPVRGVIALAEVIQQRVEEELRHPASARRDLEAAEQAHQAGEISAEEQARVQQEVLDRMTTPAAPAAGAHDQDHTDAHPQPTPHRTRTRRTPTRRRH